MAVQLTDITGIGPATVSTLSKHNYKTVKSIAKTTVEKLSAVSGFSVIRAQNTIDAAKQLLASKTSTKTKDKKNIKAKDQKSKDNKKGKDKKKKDKSRDRKKSKNRKKSDKSKSRDKKKNKKKKHRKK